MDGTDTFTSTGGDPTTETGPAEDDLTATYFDGMDDHYVADNLITTAVTDIGTGVWSLCGWGKHNNNGSGPRHIALGNIAIKTSSSGNFECRIGTTSRDYTPTDVSDNSWYFWVVNGRNDGNTEAFINGSSIGAEGHSWNFSSFTDLTIGANASESNDWTGSIDDVRLYARNLTTQEITDLYNYSTIPA